MSPSSKNSGPMHPIRRAVFRGLAVILPPLLTVLVFLWAWNMIDVYILRPSEQMAATVVGWSIRDVKSGVPDGAVVHRNQPDGPVTSFEYNGTKYVPAGSTTRWIPKTVQARVDADPPEDSPPPNTPKGYYDRYVKLEYLRRERTVPLFLALFVLVLYATGKLMAAGVGRFVWRTGERMVHRMPVVRNVYSAAKQITDSIFSEQEVQFLRVVAVEYPRKGLWTIAFVTGEGFKDLRDAAGEPILSLLVPTSPMPATGFTCTVLQRDTIDLDITVDQAVQFIVSCGVVIPPHQQWTGTSQRQIADDITQHIEQTTDNAQRLIRSA
jgi:uncharacterized membrane protein